jgi:hypothetical protein
VIDLPPGISSAEAATLLNNLMPQTNAVGLPTNAAGLPTTNTPSATPPATPQP